MSSFENANFAINGNNPKKLMTIQTIMLRYDFLNIQKCNFKKCPLIWVAPLTVILPHPGCHALQKNPL